MSIGKHWLRNHATRLVAAACIGLTFLAARQPQLSATERNALSARFRFTRFVLPTLPGYTPYTIRAVNPSLAHIRAWISSVGASVALNDLDGDGLPNDVCYVDTRIDQVIVAPVPGTPARYAPFALHPSPLPYNAKTMAPMGCLPGDFNEDGLMDILVYYWGRPPILFLQRRQNSGLAPAPLSAACFVPCEVVPPEERNERWFTNCATAADIDGDGHLDLILGNYFPDGARVLDETADDGEQMQHSMSRAFNGGRKRFLLWAGANSGPHPTVRFRDVVPDLPKDVLCGWTLAVAAADLDGDLLPEIYFANDFGPDRLLYNQSTPGHLHFKLLEGRKTLMVPRSKVLGQDSYKGMGVDIGDLNGDGRPDILVSNITGPYKLEESNLIFINNGRLDQIQQGIAPFDDRSESLGLSRSGWGWDIRLADFDNSGVPQVIQAAGFVKGRINRWPELHEIAMGNDQLVSNPAFWHRFSSDDDISGSDHNLFYVKARNGRYYDIADQLGFGSGHITRGIATADVDGDGRLDFAEANQWQDSLFYHNDSPNPGRFLGLHLCLPIGLPTGAVGTESSVAPLVYPGHPHGVAMGRPAIGAEVTVRLPDGRDMVAQVDGGNGHSGKRSPELHFGLGTLPADQTLPVTVRWRGSDGCIYGAAFALKPGWYTILLGAHRLDAHRLSAQTKGTTQQ